VKGVGDEEDGIPAGSLKRDRDYPGRLTVLGNLLGAGGSERDLSCGSLGGEKAEGGLVHKNKRTKWRLRRRERQGGGIWGFRNNKANEYGFRER